MRSCALFIILIVLSIGGTSCNININTNPNTNANANTPERSSTKSDNSYSLSQPPVNPPVRLIMDVSSVPNLRSVAPQALRYSGSTTWAPIRNEKSPITTAILNSFPWFKLQYLPPPEGEAPGTPAAIDMLERGEIAFAQTSRELPECKEKTVNIKCIKVARAFKAVAVHPSLPISALTVDQIDQICKGTIRNWRKIDPNAPDWDIVVYSRIVGTGNTPLSRSIGDECQKAETDPIPTTLINKLAKNPAGILIHAAPIIVPQCTIKTLPVINRSNQLVAPYKEPYISSSQCSEKLRNQVDVDVFKDGRYPKELGDDMYIIIKQNGKIQQQVGQAYAELLLSDEGQKKLEETGYVGNR
ncbi:phosphate ABC transporter periplasmic phosphate-binding protein (plasmid) [Calothrix sp. NIES-4101]|nr:phosphate ABC transporter periplasmic phosphate-binding protein [Calothrix sp. NIES-4101]